MSYKQNKKEKLQGDDLSVEHGIRRFVRFHMVTLGLDYVAVKGLIDLFEVANDIFEIRFSCNTPVNGLFRVPLMERPTFQNSRNSCPSRRSSPSLIYSTF